MEGYDAKKRLTLVQRTKREIDLIVRFLQPTKGISILDCPCGYGRHSIELADKGFKVTGVDLSPLYIKLCNAATKGKHLNDNANFILKDMRELDFVDESFDHVLNMFTSFGFFDKEEDNITVIKNFGRVLRPSGKLLLHFDYNATRIKNGKFFKGDEHKSRKCVYQDKNYDLYVDDFEFDKLTKRLCGSWELRNGDGKKFEYSIRIYDNDEIYNLIVNNGFSKVEFHDPENQKFTDESKETIIVAIK